MQPPSRVYKQGVLLDKSEPNTSTHNNLLYNFNSLGMLKLKLKSEDSIETWRAKIDNFTIIIKGIVMWKLFTILAPDSWNEHYVSDFIFGIVYIHRKDNLLNWAVVLYDRVPTASPISDFTCW